MKTLLMVASLSLCLQAQAGNGRMVDEMREGALPPGGLPPSLTLVDPKQGTREQALGFYSKGSLTNANLIPFEGHGFTKEIFVKDGRITENFDLPRNWSLMKAFMASGRVNRMFVNEAVKKAFCDYARHTGELESAKETLRRLRPYEGHMDHVHLRLTCPRLSPRCTSQEEVPEGSGC